MVRLKELNLHTLWHRLYLFQFQHGAIDSQKLLRICIRLILFQFQYGAIERNALNLEGLLKNLQYVDVELLN